MHHVYKMIEGYNRLVDNQHLPYNELDILIILFHDAVYEANRDFNEDESATLAEQYMETAGYGRDDIEYVVRGIIGTESHNESDVVAYNYIYDLDCAYLGTDWDVYSLCTAGIRHEYTFYFERQYWDAGRSRFLCDMLNRGKIFLTPYFQFKYEEKARANMTRELESIHDENKGA